MITETLTNGNTFTDILVREGPSGRMTRQRQSQKDPRQLISLLSPRHTIRISTWNVRSMYQTGKTSSIAEELRNYNLEILGLSEVRWIQSGKCKLSTGETVLYSGHEDPNAPHTEGVGLEICHLEICHQDAY